jgi:hypothetical protein
MDWFLDIHGDDALPDSLWAAGLLAVAAFILMVTVRTFFKAGKRGSKPRRPIGPRSGRIRRKALALRYRPPSPETIAFMEKCRMQNIAQSSGAQPTLAVCQALDQLGVRYWREEPTWYDGDCFVLSDFWLPDQRITIELDGTQHRLEQIRDIEKAQIILRDRGFRTVRFWNGEVLRPGLQDRLRELMAAV